MILEIILTAVLPALGASIACIIAVYKLVLKHRLDKELEKFRSNLATSEKKIESLQGLVVSGQLSRQALIDQRRFDALDNLWLAVRQVDKMAGHARWLQCLNLDNTFDEIKSGGKLRIVFGVLLKEEFRGKKPIPPRTEFQGHYIPKRIFALYELYEKHGIACLLIIKYASEGLDPREVLEIKGFNDEVIDHFPALKQSAELKKLIKRTGDFAWLHLLNYTRQALKLEIRNFIDGTEIDYSSIDKEISRLSLESNADVDKALASIPDEFKKDPPASP